MEKKRIKEILIAFSPAIIAIIVIILIQVFAGGAKGRDNKEVPVNIAKFFKPVEDREQIPNLTLEEAKALYDSGRAVFIDARGYNEYKESHIKGALHMSPANARKTEERIRDRLKGKVIVTYCHGTQCHLSKTDAVSLHALGYRKLAIFFGGWPEWTAAHYPVESGDPLQ